MRRDDRIVAEQGRRIDVAAILMEGWMGKVSNQKKGIRIHMILSGAGEMQIR